jgi:hypothetical protein
MLASQGDDLPRSKIMSRPFLELPEAANLTVQSLRVYDDPPYGREVHLAFTDGTEISIDLEIATTAKARHYRSDTGEELEILHQHEEPPSAAIPTGLR